MQDPNGTAAFCHHIMSNVSFNSTKEKGNIALATIMNWMLQMNEKSFAEDSLNLYDN